MPCISSHAGQYHTAIDSSLGHMWLSVLSAGTSNQMVERVVVSASALFGFVVQELPPLYPFGWLGTAGEAPDRVGTRTSYELGRIVLERHPRRKLRDDISSATKKTCNLVSSGIFLKL